MPLSVTLSYLFIYWHCHDGTPSKYAAFITFMNIWMWDGKDKNYFPNFQTGILAKWVECEDRETRAIALSGIILIVVRYGNLLPESLISRFTQWSENEQLKEEIIEVQKYLFMSATGLKMQKMLHNDVFEKMQKEQQTILEKLNLEDDEDLRMEITEEGNRRMMPYVKKLHDMVQDGVDMNLGVFASLRGLEIFKDIKNWFIDFDINHPQLESLGEKKELAKSLFSYADMCELDKYALASIVDKVTPSNSNSNQNPAQILKGLAESSATHKKENERHAYKYTFQTLFRFFNFSPWRNETFNPFQSAPFLTDYSILAPMFNDTFLWECSKFFIKNSFYSHPAAYLRSWMLHNEPTDEALELLAHCYKHLGDNQARLQCLLELEERKPKDIRLAQETGLCLIHEQRYEEALQRFFYLEVTENYLRGSARAIAWCSLMTGNIPRAKRYYQKLLDWTGGPSWEDMLNAGHCAWVGGDPVEASKLYSKYLAAHQDELSAFDNDRETLIKLGLGPDDIRLMRDTIAE